MDKQIREKILRMADNNRDVFVASLDEAGFPNMKAMFNRGHKGLHTFWFSTNTSSIRVAQFEKDSRASIYLLDALGMHGVMFVGTMKVCHDDETRRAIWKPGDKKYYPQGVTDPDYSVLEFTALHGNYYHGLTKLLFGINEIDA